LIGVVAWALALQCQALGTGHLALGSVERKCLVPSAQRLAPLVTSEVISTIQVHGNLLVPTDEIVAMSGLVAGAPFTAATIADATARLTSARKFESVQVLKRFASIEDASRIAVVILVNEGPVRLASQGGTFTPVRRGAFRDLMLMPILDAEDGYGLTYGARAAYVGKLGRQSRISFPFTWGGTKQAGGEIEWALGATRRTRLRTGAAIQRRTNPAFDEDEDDTRRRVWGRVEHARGPWRVGGTLEWQRVSFRDARDRVRSLGADAAFDTRLDPVLPRNAVLLAASWDRLFVGAADPIDRARVEARAYLGVVGPAVLALRVTRESASRSLPPYLKPLLGGWSTLRGFEAGSFFGDTIVAESIELRVPLTSPLRVGKIGVSVFADAGKAYDAGLRYRDQPLHRGAGAGVWFAAPVFHLGVAVARGHGADTRVNFGAGLTF
jgi:outer membrane protein assembly factor BamA